MNPLTLTQIDDATFSSNDSFSDTSSPVRANSIDHSIDVNEYIVLLAKRIENLERENLSLKTTIASIAQNLENTNERIKSNFDTNNKYSKSLDTRIIQNEQYSRRECIILSGIPDRIPQRKLEETVLHILRSIGLRISSYDIAACHRLHKNTHDRYPAKTIVRFINRKNADFSLRYRDSLRAEKLS